MEGEVGIILSHVFLGFTKPYFSFLGICISQICLNRVGLGWDSMEIER